MRNEIWRWPWRIGSKSLLVGHAKQHGLVLVDRMVVEIEAVPEIESGQVARDCLHVLDTVIEADRQLGAVLADGSLGASQGGEFRALDIHLDEIDSRQAKPLQGLVDGDRL